MKRFPACARRAALARCRREKAWRNLLWFEPVRRKRERRRRRFLFAVLLIEGLVIIQRGGAAGLKREECVVIETSADSGAHSEPQFEERQEHGFTVDLPGGKIEFWQSKEIRKPVSGNIPKNN